VEPAVGAARTTITGAARTSRRRASLPTMTGAARTSTRRALLPTTTGPTTGDGADGDGLDELVRNLPPSVRGRFAEICFAQDRSSYGWWPAMIYDPLLAVGSARHLAARHLGRRHLVYFYSCRKDPFAILPDAKIMAPFAILKKKQILTWEEGLLQPAPLGSLGELHRKAMEAATAARSMPAEERMMDWNSEEGLRENASNQEAILRKGLRETIYFDFDFGFD